MHVSREVKYMIWDQAWYWPRNKFIGDLCWHVRKDVEIPVGNLIDLHIDNHLNQEIHEQLS